MSEIPRLVAARFRTGELVTADRLREARDSIASGETQGRRCPECSSSVLLETGAGEETLFCLVCWRAEGLVSRDVITIGTNYLPSPPPGKSAAWTENVVRGLVSRALLEAGLGASMGYVYVASTQSRLHQPAEVTAERLLGRDDRLVTLISIASLTSTVDHAQCYESMHFEAVFPTTPPARHYGHIWAELTGAPDARGGRHLLRAIQTACSGRSSPGGWTELGSLAVEADEGLKALAVGADSGEYLFPVVLLAYATAIPGQRRRLRAVCYMDAKPIPVREVRNAFP